ncbi:MAG: hypothetical protein A3B74_03860 [Candidatus Kerfeldbacteria bacterium RIFCSPHIGHO2_02_FULL_42_14]|uniref:Glycosyl transferase family 1 domain-containing protein n=1 Tax=Candidatus Kerfeldbacteria bacterium RIFCSPHIGHO2_02_FULL_42_14 TaxID=1798540 RepID=A0A1G2AQT0_9BACT|nr:MAG: hypothetical protein A3B74_03860 [Candidatus Kerfeldbacteria bacterium RIFCSPHIGHO2_02_FULL_42_14]OGY80649.1 MAG: hypothetical protein A3E60_04360 [Candidatus Kerfeldbacteria bacterium RIFCSPHIGHO2_12_FULL_42_13]OGY82573.1 MAG: hypothetical protein A3I91_04020 [Candidatus Kerfeldbacteria bacterium RIFCSPLOWO2_02_FULL_42_19]OGY85177.1 MAG: hypothetical protein A3G01_01150 [Candidatus Kerfeldbacteria bacterium RIFCSPLOWO2_12_FULL_43_9]
MIIGIDASRANEVYRRGTEWYAFFLIKALSKIIGPEHTVFLYVKQPLRPDLAYDLPSHFVAKILRWPPVFLWTQMRLSLEMLWHPPDIFFIPVHTLPLFHPRKTVITLHDVGFERFPELYDTHPIGPQGSVLTRLFDTVVKICTLGKFGNNELDYHRWSVRFALRHAAHIITVSDFSKQEIMQLFHTSPEKLTRVYISYDERRYHPVRDQQKIADVLHKYHVQQPYVLFVASLEEKKNVLRLIEAWHSIRQESRFPHTLVLAGKPGFGYERIRRSIDAFGLTSSVHETGYIVEEDLPTLMSAADVYILPSLYEGFGIPLLQAFACATPVVASHVASIPEIAGSAAQYCNPYDAHDIARAISEVLASSTIRNRLRSLGRARLQYFSWKECGEQTWSILQHVSRA